jgi:two-component system cell cycle response regulator CtrA
MIEKMSPGKEIQLCDDRSSVLQADTADEAMSILRHETIDLVVLDLTSLAEEGFGFIRRLRVAKNDVPRVVLTGCYANDRVRALSLGADDAIAQPVDPDELRARIRAVARRHKGYSQSLVQVGELSLSLDTHEVRFRDSLVRLTEREYSFLEVLVLRKGQVVTKAMFLSHLYGGMDEPEIKIIDVFICKLRRKLSAVGANSVIGTVWGQGYIIRNYNEDARIPTAAASGDLLRPVFSKADQLEHGYGA